MAAFSSVHHQHPPSFNPVYNSVYEFHQISNIDNEGCVQLSQLTDKNSMDSTSILTDKFDSSSSHPMDRKRKCKQPNSAQSKDKRGKKQKKSSKDIVEENKSTEDVPTGYIHLRARRGQATDSHSLAERVRRERISERMKLLQELVPGCDKVTGKALMLDEIINYVQSLQNQVEFLSMKLASLNPMFYDFGLDLQTFMVRPDQDLNNLESNLEECTPTTCNNNYHLLENSPINSIMFQQVPQLTNVLSQQQQGSRQTLWEVDEHRQKIINQSGFSCNSQLFSNFH